MDVIVCRRFEMLRRLVGVHGSLAWPLRSSIGFRSQLLRPFSGKTKDEEDNEELQAELERLADEVIFHRSGDGSAQLDASLEEAIAALSTAAPGAGVAAAFVPTASRSERGSNLPPTPPSSGSSSSEDDFVHQMEGENGDVEDNATGNGEGDVPFDASELTLDQDMTPQEVVGELDRFIVGQREAKRAVAIALRNRWRRMRLQTEFREEVIPKNILMIGPTGVGKTEIARRLAKLTNAPFIKVEATKFTEVGFHGRDVDQIIRDLVDISVQQTKKRIHDIMKGKVTRKIEDVIVDSLTGVDAREETKESFRELLRSGQLEDRRIHVAVPEKSAANAMSFPAMGGFQSGPVPINDIVVGVTKMFGSPSRRSKKTEMTVREARPILEEAEIEKNINMEMVAREAIHAAEQNGIVFIDEIDKICHSGGMHSSSPDASAEGVQRDLLPLVEGSTVSTKYGNVNTEWMLFIASGAFHHVKPSDMLPELQGRLPIRVELKGLDEKDLYRILTVPKFNLLTQQVELLSTEGVSLSFTEAAVREIARVAAEVNSTVENIGARRLHTVIERIMEELSFEAPNRKGETVVVDVKDVQQHLGNLTLKTDLSKFIL